MSRRLLAAVAALGAAAGPSASAQDVGTLRARLARATAQADSIQRLRVREAEARREGAQVGTHGNVMLVLPAGTAAGSAAAAARLVDSLVTALGAFEPSLARRYVLVPWGLAPAAGQDERLAGRAVVGFVSWSVGSGFDLTRATAENAAWELVAAVLSRNPWRKWLDGSALPVSWDQKRDNESVIDRMTDEHWSRGRGCLAARAEDCAAYLGLDRSDDPLRRRFTPEDLRAEFETWPYYGPAQDLWNSCRNGDDEACYAMWPRLQSWRTEPAPVQSKHSVLFFVRAAYGKDALRRLLSDTTGSPAERFERVLGKTPEALAGEWRSWVLSSSGRTPVRAGFKEAVATVVAAGLMLALAARSGRWRV
jgi:hypothetical protein